MALAASCRACRWSAWTREIITFVAPARVFIEPTNPAQEFNVGRSGGVPADGRGADARSAAPVRSAGVGDCDRPAFPCRIDVGDSTAMAKQPTLAGCGFGSRGLVAESLQNLRARLESFRPQRVAGGQDSHLLCGSGKPDPAKCSFALMLTPIPCIPCARGGQWLSNTNDHAMPYGFWRCLAPC
jgi:hypothetical protein